MIFDCFFLFISDASVPLSCDIVSDIFQKRNLHVDESVIRETVATICSGNPMQRSIQKGGPLSTVHLRRQYYKENFSVVEPVEYILDAKNPHSFQYIPILKSLQQLLNRRAIIDEVCVGHQAHEGTYRSLRDGSGFKENGFLVGEKPRITLNLHVDDF